MGKLVFCTVYVEYISIRGVLSDFEGDHLCTLGRQLFDCFGFSIYSQFECAFAKARPTSTTESALEQRIMTKKLINALTGIIIIQYEFRKQEL